MTRFHLSVAILADWAIVGGLCAASVFADEAAGGEARIPIRRVVLFSSGVGYFEHQGDVDGSAKAELRFRTEQINDLLKSLVLLDLDGGQIGSVVYPSQDPIAKTLASFQVDLSKNPNLAALLGQLRGSAVTVQIHGKPLSGQVLGVEERRKLVDDKVFVEGWMLNLISEGTIRSVALADVQDIVVQDAELQRELTQALAALAQARDQDDKPLTLEFNGQGRRRVRVAYVVEAPVWKTSYRLILPEAGKKEAHLQGWAIVENQTDHDWSDVELALVSGRPISFVQDLYQPLYVKRPVVEPVQYAGVTPQRYEAGSELAEAEVAAKIRHLEARQSFDANTEELKALKRAAPAPGTPPPGEWRSLTGSDPRVLGQALASVQAAASGQRLGELFAYQVGSASLPRQRSAMIPIVTEPVEIERLSIYRAEVLDSHPLSGVRLTNSTNNHLLAGPLSIYDGGGYAGDASIEDLPPGQQRLLSYAIDLEVGVRLEPKYDEAVLIGGKVVRGVLHTQHRYRQSRVYHLDNRGGKEKRLLIEHPLRKEWSLVDSPKPVEETDEVYRFEVKLAAGKSEDVSVHQEFVASETLAMLDGDADKLALFQQTRGMPAPVRDALQQVLERRRALAGTQQEIKRRRDEIQAITREQERIRANIASAGQSDLHNRLLKKLDDQETRIEQLQAEIRDLESKEATQRAELEKMLEGLTLG